MTNTDAFKKMGGQFVMPPDTMRESLSHIKAFLFDWDGVFNDGVKFGDQGSPFSEQDSMGVNLLRLGYWLDHDHQMPVTGIITGATNAGVDYFTARESIDFCIRGFTNKQEAWEHFLRAFDIAANEVAFIFDDVLDLAISRHCALRFCVRRDASPAFKSYILEQGLCDYISGHSGGHGAVREICELMLTLSGLYSSAVDTRLAYDETYRLYLNDRKAIQTSTVSA